MKKHTGIWCTPLAPDEAMTGTLTLRFGYGPRLELHGSQNTKSAQSSKLFNHPQALEQETPVIVHGQAQSGNLFTLYDGFVQRTTFGMGASSTSYLYFNRGFEGACIDDPSTLEVDGVYMRYPGMNAWLGVQVFDIDYDNTIGRVSVSSTMPQEEAFSIDDNREFVIAWSRRAPGRSSNQTRIDIEVLPWFGIRYSDPVPQAQASNDVFILGQMLSLLFGRPTASRRICMYSPHYIHPIDGNHRVELRSLSAHFKLPESFKKWLTVDVLIPFSSVRDQFSSLLTRWFDMHHKCWGAIVPYMSGQLSPAPLADRRFFDFAASAESVHAHFCPDETNFSAEEADEIWSSIREDIPKNRREYYKNTLCRVNALTYRQRLEGLFGRFPDLAKDVLGDSGSQAKFFRLVKDLRNVEAHRLRRTGESNVGGRKLVHIAAKLKTESLNNRATDGRVDWYNLAKLIQGDCHGSTKERCTHARRRTDQ